MKKHLIVGNGGAAISAVRAIRRINSDDEITVISKESCCAYSPVCLTYYMRGSIGREDVFICEESLYRQNKVNIVLGRKATNVDTKLRRVYTYGGEARYYDDLLIATGSSPVIPSIEGVNLPGVFVLRTIYDAERIISFLGSKESVAIIGSGLAAIQALGALINRGKKVVLAARRHQILRKILDLQGARILEERLYQEGADIRLNEPVLGIHGNDRKKVISLASGAELTADAVILAVGAHPNVDFIKGSRIELSSGIVIDQHCRTSKEGIYAAGDVAEAYDPITSHYTINATWPNAIEQGRVAGLNMAGKEASILRNIRFNIFTLFGFSCASLGLTRADGIKPDEIVLEHGVVYRKLFFKEGLLVGAVLLGDIDDAGIIVSLIQRRSMFPKLYEVLLRRGVSSNSVTEYWWSTSFRIKAR